MLYVADHVILKANLMALHFIGKIIILILFIKLYFNVPIYFTIFSRLPSGPIQAEWITFAFECESMPAC